MHNVPRVVSAAMMLFVTVGCTQKSAPTYASSTTSHTGDVAKSPSTKTAEKKDLAATEVKLVPVTFKLAGVELSIDAPERARVANAVERFCSEVLFGNDNCLSITQEAKVADELARWKKGDGFTKAQRYLIEQPDAFLIEASENEERRFVCVAEREVGGLKYTVALARPNSGQIADLSTKEECLLALKCAKTLRLKEPAKSAK